MMLDPVISHLIVLLIGLIGGFIIAKRMDWTEISRIAFDGLIDEVRIYNRTLSPAEIQRLYRMAR